MEAFGIVIGMVALCVLGLTVLLAATVVRTGRAVGRRVEKHGAQARRAVEDAGLKARSYAQPGAQGQIAALRLEVRSSLAATRQVLDAGVGDDPQLGEALQLLAQLESHGRELDGELRMLERESGAARVKSRLPVLREQAERVTHAAESLRWAAQDRAHRFGDDALGRLSQECEAEAAALRHWAPVQAPADVAAGAAAGTGPAAQQPRQEAVGRSALAAERRGMAAEQALKPPAEPERSFADRLRKRRPNSRPPTVS